MVVVVITIINVVFGIIHVVFVEVNCESPKLNPAFKIIIVSVIDEAKGPVILRTIVAVVLGFIINVVFGIVIATVVIIVIVNCEVPTLLDLTLHPTIWIIIVDVDEVKGPIIGVRGLDTAVGTVIV